jgi:hypothetical protein
VGTREQVFRKDLRKWDPESILEIWIGKRAFTFLSLLI